MNVYFLWTTARVCFDPSVLPCKLFATPVNDTHMVIEASEFPRNWTCPESTRRIIGRVYTDDGAQEAWVSFMGSRATCIESHLRPHPQRLIPPWMFLAPGLFLACLLTARKMFHPDIPTKSPPTSRTVYDPVSPVSTGTVSKTNCTIELPRVRDTRLPHRRETSAEEMKR